MARKKIKCGETSALDRLRVDLIPSLKNANEDILRIQEIRHLVAHIVLLGKKRGRPSKQTEEIDHAA